MNNESTESIPAVGVGVTLHIGSDRYAGTITKVSKSGKAFWFTKDVATLISGNASSETQQYSFSPNLSPNAEVERASLRRDGVYRLSSGSGYAPRVRVGVKVQWLDPGF